MDIEIINQKLSEKEYQNLHMQNADKAVGFLCGFPEIEGYKPKERTHNILCGGQLTSWFGFLGDFKKRESKHGVFSLFGSMVYRRLKKDDVKSIQDILNDKQFVDEITDCLAVINLKSNDAKTKQLIQMVYKDIINEPIE